ncbi:Ldh family oxidoreductase [Caldinitratiruptor microaerophilus]|uniref:Lactate dehydrogenase n=1 Tax=Caldinitratiruptor microaerophilus TaxID=671077 RepID=A0AA35G7C5_9FIRM|nr:Ldh family oxidoreductase [Caldinitratiruptor microaerophilus]BDG59178.1 lactate dehydrogenase [Caldinitratiruptor microaerophilus]
MNVAPHELQAYVRVLFTAAGLPENDAAVVAENLVFADLRGVESHGVSRVPVYLRRLQEGAINPRPSIKVSGVHALCAVDGDGGMGAVVASQAMRTVLEQARRFGIGAAFVRNSNHFGMASYYTLMAAREGMIGIATTNAPPAMAAWGGVEPVLGTNPLSIAFPAPDGGDPIVLDMATSTVARGKIRLAADRGEPIPQGWALDASGKPTTDPAAALQGTLFPLGGVKGYCLAVAVDLLSGVFAGAGYANRLKQMYGRGRGVCVRSRVGHFLLAIDPGQVQPQSASADALRDFRARLQGGPRAGSAEILLPGELEARFERVRRRDGIPLSEHTRRALAEVAHELGISARL